MAKSKNRQLGDVGENIACEFLRRRGFEIIDRNYLRKWGEIDIVATKSGQWHFVEVKSASGILTTVGTRETSGARNGAYRPEENVHPQKLRRLYRAIETYLLEKRIDAEWQLDVVMVRVDMGNRIGRCELLENITG